MKKIITVLGLCAVMMCGGYGMYARTTKSSAKKAKTTSTVSVKKNMEGVPQILGHSYTARMSDGSKYTYTFQTSGQCKVKLSIGSRSQTAEAYWEQNGYVVDVYDMDSGTLVFRGEVSEDGRNIAGTSMYGEDFDLKLVR